MTIAIDIRSGAVVGQLVQNYNREGKPQLRLLTRGGKYLNYDRWSMRLETV